MAIYKNIVKKIPVSADKKIKQKQYLSKGLLPIIDQGQQVIAGYTDDTEKQIECDYPVIVFGDHTRCVKLVDFPFAPGADGIKVIKPIDESVNINYLFYATKYLASKIRDKGYARHYQDVEKQSLEIPLLQEQKRIVSKIEELFSSLDNSVEILNKTKKQLVVYRQAVLKEAFEGKWSYKRRTNINSDFRFKEVLDKDKMNVLPNGWEYVYLSDLGDLSRGKSKHRPRNDERLFENGKYPFFQTGDVKSAKKRMVECEKKYGEFGLAQSKLWPAGTLCITIAANIAETSFLGVDGCFPDSIVGFTPNSSMVNKEYVRYFIESSKQRLWAFAPATAQKNINLSTLENLVIPYCSLDEQKYIVNNIESRLSECESIEAVVETALLQAEVLRQSILKEAFEGRLI